MDEVRSLLQLLRKSYKAIKTQRVSESSMNTDIITNMITDIISGIICLSMGSIQDSGAVIGDCTAALNGQSNSPRIFQSC